MLVKAAIFDLDGTILDSMVMWKTLASRYIRSIGKKPAPDVDKFIESMSIEEVVKHLKEEYDISNTPEGLKRDILKVAYDFYMKDAMYKKGAEDILKEFKKADIPMYLATATDREVVEPALRKIGCLDYFQGMLTCSEVNASKREPIIYDTALKLLGAEKSETLVFEDHYYAAKTAIDAGYKVIGIYEEHTLHSEMDLQEVCNFYLESYMDWPGICEINNIL